MATCDVRPGPRPTGPALLAYVEDYRRRAGISAGATAHEQQPVRPARRRRGRRRARRPPAAGRVLHRHLGVHRLQGLRGGVQAVERGAGRASTSTCWGCRTTTPGRSAPTPGGTWRSSSSRRPGHAAGRPGHAGASRRGGTGAETRTDFRWLMASDVCKHCTHAGCLDVCPTGRAVPHRVRLRRRAAGHLQRLRLLRVRLPVRGDRAAARRRAGAEVHALLRPAARRPRTGLRQGLPDRLDPVRRARRAARAGGGAGAPPCTSAARPAPGSTAPTRDDGVGGNGAFFLLLDEPEVYGLPPDPVVPTRGHERMWGFVGAAAPGLPGRGGRRVRCGRAGATGEQARQAGGVRRRAADPDSYYGRPILKPPAWDWRIPAYLFAGRAVRRLDAAVRRRRPHRAARAAPPRPARRGGRARREHLLPGLRPGPARAVPPHAAGGQTDLADERRHLDHRRATAPGSGWPRSASCCRRGGGVTPLAGARGWPARPALSSAALAPALASYTAVLLSQTAVPAWNTAHPYLPFVFTGSAAASSGGLGDAARAGGRGRARPARSRPPGRRPSWWRRG